MRLVYLDCAAGIAGDMLLAALIDLGAPLEEIRAGLGGLHLTEPWSLRVEPVMRRGIHAQRAVVQIDGEEADSQFVDHDHENHHDHHHHHEHEHGPSRPYREIRRLLDASDLPQRVRERAHRIFAVLAEAEGSVHGVSPEEVHFHEVGSTDAIIDVVGCCLALEFLQIDAVEASPLHVGKGFVTAAHGRMPVPAPATLRLLIGLSIYQTDISGELVTPTGAALVKGLCRRVGPMPLITVQQVGHGAGKRDRELPNVVRTVLAEVPEETGFERDTTAQLSANLDDMNPQISGALMDRLLADGALDAWIEPVTMKKGRPGHVLNVLVPWGQESRFAGTLLRETTTLGVRARSMSRWMLAREWIEVETDGGTVRVKLGIHQGDVWNVAPEYDDCVQAAHTAGLPLKIVMDQARHRAASQLEAGSDKIAKG